MHKNVFTLAASFTDSHTEDEPNLPRQNNVNLLKKKLSSVDVTNKSGTFQGPKPNSRTSEDNLVKFKTFSRLYEP